MSQGSAQWAGGLGPHPVPGDKVGTYRLEAVLGAGGLATVFRALDHNDATVAVKVLNPARVLPEEVKRFTREYRALARMDHPNIVRVHEAGVHEGYPWIAMEYVDGTDLDTEISRWKASDPHDRWERIAHIVRGLCRGLTYIHDMELIHRDLKPGNVLLTASGDPKLSDFGVVKSGDGSQTTQLTMAGRLVGTVAFMAPELITDEGIDPRTDLYALGAVIYLMCTYRRPIEADSVAGYLARHLTEIPRPMGEIDPSVPPVLERITARLLQKDRSYRYPSAQAVLQALDRSEDPDALPLRGRDEQQTYFARRLVTLAEGQGGVIAWVGPRGAGKSHLLKAFEAQAQGHVRIVTTEGGAETLQTLARKLDLVTDRIDGSTVSAAMGEDPLIIVVDDLDKAQTATIGALAKLVRQRVSVDRARLLLIYTATDAEQELSSLSNGLGASFELFELGPVDPKVVVAMLRDRGVTGPLAPLLARRLHADYAGQPGPMMLQVEALQTAGWLVRAGDTLRAMRPLDEFRKADLPVAEVLREQLLAKLSELEPEDRELCELLALIDRPSTTGLLERCRDFDPGTQRRIDGLVKARLLIRVAQPQGQGPDDAGWEEMAKLADPTAARVIRSTLPPEAKRRLHAAIAAALSSRKRREGALEVAIHLRAAGDDAAAYPLYVAAARRVARDGRYGEVLDICDAALQVRTAAEGSLDPAKRPQLARWLYLLRGEALLARAAWDEAVEPLQAAVQAAREEGDPPALARATSSLGRAHYRAGRFSVAEPLLSSALQTAEQGAPERASALRALADIALRAGRLPEAETLWNDAMAAAVQMGSRDAEARARRGLAHLRAIQGRLQDAADLLAQADDLLNPDGDHRVRAGVLARAIEIDTASGQFGAALYRAETLVELARRHGMGERLPDAYALLADLLLRLGEHAEAEDAAQQSLVFANATDRASWDSRMRTASVLASLGKGGEAFGALPPHDALGPSPVDDPPAQYAALTARLFAQSDPSRARDLATWSLTRPPPLLLLSGVRIASDAAEALLLVGQTEAARNAVKRGLKLLSPHDDGIRLELLVLMQRASPDPRVIDAIRQIAQRMLPLLPKSAVSRFRARDIICLALAES